MILIGETIRALRIMDPHEPRTKHLGMTYGEGPAGYDVRVEFKAGDRTATMSRGGFMLASTMERFTMPLDVLGRVCDKSSWIRRGLHVGNTVIEPGWRGYLTLELTNYGPEDLFIQEGAPIAQIIFERLEKPTVGYDGKYQDQPRGPMPALYR